MKTHPVTGWIDKAEGNYNSALVLLRQRTRLVPDVVCNQCQQCAEKYLKAMLFQYDIPFSKTLDLIKLENRIAQVDAQIRLLQSHLARLNPYGIDVCYPGLDATVSDAREAVQAMKTVRKFVRAKLGLKP